MCVNQIFDNHHYKEKKVRVASIELTKYVFLWDQLNCAGGASSHMGGDEASHT